MEVFKLTVDRKVEVWRRDHVEIEAESLEEAVNKAIKHDYLVPDDSEYLYDTECTMDSRYFLTTLQLLKLWMNTGIY